MKLETAQLKFSINKWWNLENITGETLKKKKKIVKEGYIANQQNYYFIYIYACVLPTFNGKKEGMKVHFLKLNLVKT
jgi:hypothetical protein